MCLGAPNTPLRLDSTLLDSNHVFGINALPKDRGMSTFSLSVRARKSNGTRFLGTECGEIYFKLLITFGEEHS